MVMFLYKSLRKDKAIKVRISEKQKNYFKEVAGKCNIDLSELVLTATQRYAEQRMEHIETTPEMIERIKSMENSIPKLKEKMKSRKEQKKAHKWLGFLNR